MLILAGIERDNLKRDREDFGWDKCLDWILSLNRKGCQTSEKAPQAEQSVEIFKKISRCGIERHGLVVDLEVLD